MLFDLVLNLILHLEKNDTPLMTQFLINSLPRDVSD